MYPCKWEFANVCKHTLCMFCSHCADLSTGRIPCAQTARHVDKYYAEILRVTCPIHMSSSSWLWWSRAVQLCAKWGLDLSTACTCMPPRQPTIRQIDLLVHIPRIFSSGRDWTFGILKNTLNFVNTNIFKYYYKNLLNIGENVPVADFGHYADYCAQLIPLSLLKSTLGGGDGARVMLHQICFFTNVWTCNMIFVLHCIKLPLC